MMKRFKHICKHIVVITLFSCVGTVNANELLKTSTSWNGGSIYYPTGAAEVTSAKVKIADGQALKPHCHPVPTFGYVLEGTLEVETNRGKKVLLSQGEAVLEVMKTVHKGTAIGGDAEVLVFFAGAKGVPNTVFLDSEDAEKYCESFAQ